MAKAPIEQQLASEVDHHEALIDADISAKLASRRAAAVSNYESPNSVRWVWGGGAAAACALVVALMLPFNNTTLEQPMVADKDLVENLEFYTWLADQPLNEVGAN